jgi:hypothetical protein
MKLELEERGKRIKESFDEELDRLGAALELAEMSLAELTSLRKVRLI